MCKTGQDSGVRRKKGGRRLGIVLSSEVCTPSPGRMPSAYANQNVGELSSMCDAPQTDEALTVRRSRDGGGVRLDFTQENVREVLEGVWKS